MTGSEPHRLAAARRAFFLDVLESFSSETSFATIVITHCLADRPEFIRALDTRHPVVEIVSIPYSAHGPTLALLEETFAVARPSLDELENPEFVEALVSGAIARAGGPVAVVEIGGYCAAAVDRLVARHGAGFLGCVEDTEGGHRRYEALPMLPCPVVSVARSPLKLIEDRLIGPSIMFSIESVLREIGQPLVGITLGVMGYGRIGAGIARAALARVGRVVAFDSSNRQRALAVADGINSPTRTEFLRQADVLVGATGNCCLSAEDLAIVKDGCFLVSASSRQIELPVQHLVDAAQEVVRGPGVSEYRIGTKTIILVGDGYPINFMHGAVVGPAINLVQGEILVGIATLDRARARREIVEIAAGDQDILVGLWLDHFVDPLTGRVKSLPDLSDS